MGEAEALAKGLSQNAKSVIAGNSPQARAAPELPSELGGAGGGRRPGEGCGEGVDEMQGSGGIDGAGLDPRGDVIRGKAQGLGDGECGADGEGLGAFGAIMGESAPSGGELLQKGAGAAKRQASQSLANAPRLDRPCVKEGGLEDGGHLGFRGLEQRGEGALPRGSVRIRADKLARKEADLDAIGDASGGGFADEPFAKEFCVVEGRLEKRKAEAVEFAGSEEQVVADGSGVLSRGRVGENRADFRQPLEHALSAFGGGESVAGLIDGVGAEKGRGGFGCPRLEALSHEKNRAAKAFHASGEFGGQFR